MFIALILAKIMKKQDQFERPNFLSCFKGTPTLLSSTGVQSKSCMSTYGHTNSKIFFNQIFVIPDPKTSLMTSGIAKGGVKGAVAQATHFWQAALLGWSGT